MALYLSWSCVNREKCTAVHSTPMTQKSATDSLQRSRRRSKSVCNFITEKIGIELQPHHERTSAVHFEDDPAAVVALYRDFGKVKLFTRST